MLCSKNVCKMTKLKKSAQLEGTDLPKTKVNR